MPFVGIELGRCRAGSSCSSLQQGAQEHHEVLRARMHDTSDGKMRKPHDEQAGAAERVQRSGEGVVDHTEDHHRLLRAVSAARSSVAL